MSFEDNRERVANPWEREIRRNRRQLLARVKKEGHMSLVVSSFYYRALSTCSNILQYNHIKSKPLPSSRANMYLAEPTTVEALTPLEDTKPPKPICGKDDVVVWEAKISQWRTRLKDKLALKRAASRSSSPSSEKENRQASVSVSGSVSASSAATSIKSTITNITMGNKRLIIAAAAAKPKKPILAGRIDKSSPSRGLVSSAAAAAADKASSALARLVASSAGAKKEKTKEEMQKEDRKKREATELCRIHGYGKEETKRYYRR